MKTQKMRRVEKFVSTHSSVTPAAKNVAKELNKRDEVVAIRPGIIKNRRTSKPRLSCKVIAGGLEVDVIGRTAVQTLLIRTDDINATWEFLDGLTVEGQ